MSTIEFCNILYKTKLIHIRSNGTVMDIKTASVKKRLRIPKLFRYLDGKVNKNILPSLPNEIVLLSSWMILFLLYKILKSLKDNIGIPTISAHF